MSTTTAPGSKPLPSSARNAEIVVIDHANVAPTPMWIADALRACGLANVAVVPGFAAFAASIERHAGTQVLLVSTASPMRAETMDRLPALKGIVYIATGTESVDLEAATERGIVVAHGPTPLNVDSMAEATVLLMLSLLYDIARTQRLLAESAPRPAQPFSRLLAGKTIGLVGFGRIGRAVAQRLKDWQADILVATRHADLPDLPHIRGVALDELLAASDVVSIHAALNDATRRMIGAAELARMKPGAFLINTARGGLVDEAALCEALAARRIRGAALDTFAVEPLPADSPLRRLDNVILTPHIIGHTVEAQDSLLAIGVDNICCILAGEPPRYLRNPEVVPAWLRRQDVRSS